MSFELTALLLSWIAIALLGLALSGILRQIHILRSALVPPSRAAITGERVHVPELAPRHTSATVALFSDPNCPSCDRLVPVFAELAERYEAAEFALVLAGEANGTKAGRVQVLDNNRALFEAIDIPVTPYAIVVDQGGVVRESSPAGSPAMLEEIVRSATNGGES